jgi:hypothetical protein
VLGPGGIISSTTVRRGHLWVVLLAAVEQDSASRSLYLVATTDDEPEGRCGACNAHTYRPVIPYAWPVPGRRRRLSPGILMSFFSYFFIPYS